jgi:hypothetical protein
MGRTRVNSKQKGNRFQYTVSQIMTAFDGEEYKSVPASGALRWGNISWTWGDILPPAGVKLVTECKHHRHIAFDTLLFKQPDGLRADTRLFLDFWFQAASDAERAAHDMSCPVTPLLVWKRQMGRPIATVEYAVIASATSTAKKRLLWQQSMRVRFGKLDLVCADIETMFKAATPRQLAEAATASNCNLISLADI